MYVWMYTHMYTCAHTQTRNSPHDDPSRTYTHAGPSPAQPSCPNRNLGGLQWQLDNSKQSISTNNQCVARLTISVIYFVLLKFMLPAYLIDMPLSGMYVSVLIYYM